MQIGVLKEIKTLENRVALTPAGGVLEVSGDGVLMAPRGRSLADLPLLSWDAGPPAAALAEGSDILVIGRPITDADEPAAAVARLLDELR